MRNKKCPNKPVAELQINCGSMEELGEALLRMSNVLLIVRKKLLLRILQEKLNELERSLELEPSPKKQSVENNTKRRHRHGHQEPRK